ncbi:MAG: 2OG-Fe(II) oxygenase [Bacteroidia bacterium]
MEAKFERLIAGLVEEHFGIVGNFLSPELYQQLRLRLNVQRDALQFHNAGIGKKETQSIDQKVRGDQICWLDKAAGNPAELAFLAMIDAFILYLNRTCYTGIQSSEFHFAIYPIGSFYRRHLDQFRLDDKRKYSMVFYLNDDWEAADGGELLLFLPQSTITINPTLGKVVCFSSGQLEHEVKIAHHERLSITGWLKV